MSIPYMPLYVADYLGDTQHLSTEQHGAYMLLLMALWRAGGRLPSDPIKLARIVRLSPSKWARIGDDVMAFFDAEDDVITQKRLAVEIEKASKKSQVRSVAGKAGANAKALKNNKATKANASPLLKHSSEPEPDSTDPGGSVPRERWPADAFDQFWTRYPAKVGKAAASAAFAKVRKSNLVAFAALLAGLDAYVRHKPPDRDWCHPTTWLNQGRWDDEWTDGQPQQHRNGTGAGGGRKPSATDNLLAGFAAVAARYDRGGDLHDAAGEAPGPADAHAGPTIDLEARRGGDPRDDAPWPDAGDYRGGGASARRLPGH